MRENADAFQRDIPSCSSRSIANKRRPIRSKLRAYLDGFSPNVQDILEKFEFRNQIPRLAKADALGTLIENLLSPAINLSPNPVLNGDGSVKQPALDNHAMGRFSKN